MNLNKQFIVDYSDEKIKDINPELFDRTAEQPIYEYIIKGLRVIESLPYITFTSWRHVTDASKIDVKLNRKHIKSKDVLRDKSITKISSIRDTAQEMLILKFKIDYDGETRYITKELLIPSYVDRYHLLVNGRYVLPQKQFVDVSTYSSKGSLTLKTTLTPVDVKRVPVKYPLVSTTDEGFMISTFMLNLFTKELNPLYYFIGKFAVRKTIRYFGLRDIIDITNKVYDDNIYWYFKVSDSTYVEVDKRFFNRSDYIQAFTYMIYDIMKTNNGDYKTCDDKNFWLTKLGSMFTTNTKNQRAKGANVLISFERILDDITKETIRLDKHNMKSTYSLLRWMIGNYAELRKKDNHDLGGKRIRCNELTASYFIQSMMRKINHLLNQKKLTIDSIVKIFSWNPDELFRQMMSSKDSLLKYDPAVNCFDLLSALVVTTRGPQGLSGGKNVKDEYRDIYANQLGRVDVNSISHGPNTGLTQLMSPRCKIHGNGFFSKESSDPDNYGENINKLRERVCNPAIEIMKTKYQAEKDVELSKCDNYDKLRALEKRDGCYVIHSRYKVLTNYDDKTVVIASRHPKDPFYRRTHRGVHGQLLDSNDNQIIKRRNPIRIKNGCYVLTRICENKQDDAQKKTD